MLDISGKTIVAIFAHPDDETFGPSGTLYKLAQKNDVYVICATCGEAGENHLTDASKQTLAEIRCDEISRSGKILGLKKVFFLKFEDGTLSNNLYHQIAEKIEEILQNLKPEMLITFEQRGVSGHLDHIAMSMITTFVFKKLPFSKTLAYNGMTTERAAERHDYFIHFPEGYAREEFDEIVDVADVWDVKVAAMREHKSQAKDMENILKSAEKFPKEEYFFLRHK